MREQVEFEKRQRDFTLNESTNNENILTSLLHMGGNKVVAISSQLSSDSNFYVKMDDFGYWVCVDGKQVCWVGRTYQKALFFVNSVLELN